jgi:hypothetical protein
MIPYLVRAALAAAAAVSVLVIGGVAQAGDPKNQDGSAGEPSTATVICRWLPPAKDMIFQCTALPRQPGAGGPTIDY